jgi:DsbC/DsbD-like thiol-disulfide interchange protein
MVYMFRPLVRRFAIFAASFVVNAAMTMPPGWAADASGWDGDQRSAARIIAGTVSGQPNQQIILRAGIEIRLAPGWKTYWRYPGDAGVAPRFDFQGSENVKTITVLWPVPQRFSEDGINLIGYKGDVVLPLHIVPENPRKAVTVHLKLDYGICEKICIPVEARISLVVSGELSSHEAALSTAEDRVPKQVALGEGRTLAIRAVSREAGSTPPRVVIDVAAPEWSNVDLFAEGPTPDWSLPLPEPISTQAGIRRFAFDLAGVPPDAKPQGSVLKFTAIADDEAIEVSTPLH